VLSSLRARRQAAPVLLSSIRATPALRRTPTVSGGRNRGLWNDWTMELLSYGITELWNYWTMERLDKGASHLRNTLNV
jgi:hypothetical protein